MDEREERELRKNTKNYKINNISKFPNETKTSMLLKGLHVNPQDKKGKKDKKDKKGRGDSDDDEKKSERESVKEKIQRLKNERNKSDTSILNTGDRKSFNSANNTDRKSNEVIFGKNNINNLITSDDEDEEEEEKEQKKSWFERRKEKKELQKRLKEKREKIRESKMQEEETNNKNLFKIHVKLRKIIKSSHFANLFITSFEEKEREKIHWMVTVWGEIEYASEFMNREDDYLTLEDDNPSNKKKSSKSRKQSNDFIYASDEDSSTIDDVTIGNFQQTLNDIYRFYLSVNQYKALSTGLQKKLDEHYKNGNVLFKTVNFQLFEETQKEIEAFLKSNVEKFYDNFLEALTFNKPNKKEEMSVDDLFTTDLNGYLFLRAGTIPRILDWILWNKHEIARSDIIAFFLSYKPFYNSVDLLQLMIDRYKNPKLLPFSEQTISITNTKRLIADYVKLWVSLDKIEFTNSKNLMNNLVNFADELGENDFNLALLKMKNKKTSNYLMRNESTLCVTPKLTILDCISEQMLVDVLTYLEVDSFVAIQPIEYVNWKGKNKEINAPNLAKSAERFSQVTNFIVKQILTVDDKTGASIIELLIKSSRILKLNNNFNCLMQVVCAFSNGDLMSTKKTRPKLWSQVSAKLLTELEEIEEFMLPIGNFKNYRLEYVKSINQKTPIVPYLPVHLRDLIYINDGNPDKLEDELLPKNYVPPQGLCVINFEKIQLVGKEISQLILIRDMLSQMKYDYNPQLVEIFKNI